MLNICKKTLCFFALVGALFAGTAILSCSNSANSLVTIEQKESDWLFILYLDADSNLNDDIWANLVQAEYGLSNMLNDDGTIKSGRPSVNIVALWDGANEDTLAQYNLTRSHPGAVLLELGPMDAETATIINQEAADGYQGEKPWRVSKYSVDLTATASSWLSSEPDMGDVKTLTNFLKWTKARYTAKNIVLSLNDHGSGTEYETKSGAYGATANAATSFSLCNDDTNKTNLLLSAVDVKQALADSGVTPNILWMDCCLQGNAETAYLLRGVADYLVTSANVSYSHEYTDALAMLTTDSTPESFGRALVKEYATTYKSKNVKIDTPNKNRTSYDEMLTNMQISLDTTKQEALYAAIDALAEKLLGDGDTVVAAVFNNYLKQTPTNVETCKGMTFPGTYTFLSDIGYFCYDLVDNQEKDKSTVGVSDETVQAAKNVLTCLDAVVKTAWYGKADSTASQIWYKKNLDDIEDVPYMTNADFNFGLTIAASANDDGTFAVLFAGAYAKTTGYSANWGKLALKWSAEL